MYHELYFVFKQSLFNLYYTIFNASVYKRDKRTFFLVRDNLPIPPIYPIHGEPSSIIYRTRVSRNSSRSGGADSWNNNKFSARIIFIGLADYLPRDGCWTRPDANKRSDFPRCRGLHSQIWLANKRGAHARAALDTRRTRCFASLIRSLAHLHLLIAIPSLRKPARLFPPTWRKSEESQQCVFPGTFPLFSIEKMIYRLEFLLFNERRIDFSSKYFHYYPIWKVFR